MPIHIFFALIISSCSMLKRPVAVQESPKEAKEFSHGEVILANQLLSKIFDQEMPPLSCVGDTDDAALLLRTINPRMELVQDEWEAKLDDINQIKELIKHCDQNCTCHYLDDLLQEHQVALDKNLRTQLDKKKKQKDLNSCLAYVQDTFCSGELFQTLNAEKKDFSYDETGP